MPFPHLLLKSNRFGTVKTILYALSTREVEGQESSLQKCLGISVITIVTE